MWSFRTHTDAVAEDRLRGKEVHALVTYRGRHRERSGQRDVHQRDDHATGIRDTALLAYVHVRVKNMEDNIIRDYSYDGLSLAN